MPDREPLWASSLADQPRRDDDVVTTWEREDDEPSPAPRTAPQPVWPQAIMAGAAILVALVALTAALSGGGSLIVEDVPSGWVDEPMTCHTARFETGVHAIELFRCHAIGAGRLPPGIYRSPRDQWTSDITRRDALADVIRISPRGVLTGVALY